MIFDQTHTKGPIRLHKSKKMERHVGREVKRPKWFRFDPLCFQYAPKMAGRHVYAQWKIQGVRFAANGKEEFIVR